MSNQVIEIADIKLASGKTEADLVAASAQFQKEFLSAQPGFLSRKLVRKKDGTFADILRWESMEAVETIMEKVADSEACQRYFSCMEADAQDPDAAPVFMSIIASYGTAEQPT